MRAVWIVWGLPLRATAPYWRVCLRGLCEIALIAGQITTGNQLTLISLTVHSDARAADKGKERTKKSTVN